MIEYVRIGCYVGDKNKVHELKETDYRENKGYNKKLQTNNECLNMKLSIFHIIPYLYFWIQNFIMSTKFHNYKTLNKN